MSQANPYDELLAVLLAAPDRKLELEVNVGHSALRKGLVKALAAYNENSAALALVLGNEAAGVIEGVITVKPTEKPGVMVVALGPKTQSKFQSNLSFTVLGSADFGKEADNE